MDARPATVEGIAHGIASYLATVRTKPLHKAQIAKAFGVSLDYVPELLKTIPGVRTIGERRKRGQQYTLPLAEMPLEYQLECGLSRFFGVLQGCSRNDPKLPQVDLGQLKRSA